MKNAIKIPRKIVDNNRLQPRLDDEPSEILIHWHNEMEKKIVDKRFMKNAIIKTISIQFSPHPTYIRVTFLDKELDLLIYKIQ